MIHTFGILLTSLLLMQVQTKQINFLFVSQEFSALEPSITLASITHSSKGKSCQTFTAPAEIVAAVNNARTRNEIVRRVNVEEMKSILKTCPKSPSLSTNAVRQSGGLIFPGTKWCGPGDVAEHYDDLGPEKETDMCCRDHDHCDTISAGESKFNLTNLSPFTRLHCECDNVFTKCLKNANTAVSNAVGEFYFNMVKNPCYDFNYPIIKCKREIVPKTCQEFEFDESKPKLYQWFLPQYYEKPKTAHY